MTVRFERSPFALLVAAVLALGLVLGSAGEARASHYYLTDVEWFTTPQMIALRDAGIQTTEHLLSASLTAAAREKLASRVELSPGEILDLARQCELLQIRGVGPKVVRLLEAAGVEGVDALARSDAKKLLAKIEKVNASSKITEINPSIEIVSYWVKEAMKASLRVEL